jgi:hypothetical protein
MRLVSRLVLGGFILVSVIGGAVIAHSAIGKASQPSVIVGEVWNGNRIAADHFETLQVANSYCP